MAPFYVLIIINLCVYARPFTSYLKYHIYQESAKDYYEPKMHPGPRLVKYVILNYANDESWSLIFV